MPSIQSRYFMLTIPGHQFIPYLPLGISWIRGQLELGTGGFRHWQLVVAFPKKVTLRTVIKCFGPYHAEPTRSEAAIAYVWKEETRIAGTQFELGARSTRRNSKVDWELVWSNAKAGALDEIPASIRVRNYRTLRTIRSDYAKPIPVERTIRVFWGVTGSGKSRRAWEEAGLAAYPKDPRTKFWDGYQGQGSVVMDEFRGAIDVSHLLRWFDRYPVNVEIKGSSMPLVANNIWITSNIPPEAWFVLLIRYPQLDAATFDALKRRLVVTHFSEPFR
jgi:hypothetical protein